MLLFAVANLALAIGVYVVGSAGYGIAETVAFSKFRDLQFHHVVNVDPANFGQIANVPPSDLADIPHFLTESFRGDLTVIDLAAAACLANAFLWALYSWLTRLAVSRNVSAIACRLSRPKLRAKVGPDSSS